MDAVSSVPSITWALLTVVAALAASVTVVEFVKALMVVTKVVTPVAAAPLT
jgi:hypothetical protein